MRRIAAGLPLAIPLLTAPFNVGGCYPLGYTCPTMPNPVTVEYVAADAGAGDAGPLDCVSICGSDVHCEVADESHVECVHMVQQCPPAGRLPDAPTYASQHRLGNPALAWLTQTAALEAASVVAFERLADQLHLLGAPENLTAGARRSAHDERRHAAAVGALVARRGGPRRIEVRVGPPAPADLRTVALHNAAEGCVREAWGALEAAAQATRATDSDVRATYAVIAPDEARHALLSFAIDDWARTQLGGATLDEARAAARLELEAHLEERTLPQGLGLLSAAEAQLALS